MQQSTPLTWNMEIPNDTVMPNTCPIEFPELKVQDQPDIRVGFLEKALLMVICLHNLSLVCECREKDLQSFLFPFNNSMRPVMAVTSLFTF